MKNLNVLFAMGCVVLGLSACQSTPRQYNGVTGYQIENQTATSATIAYTLAGRANRQLDESKLLRACQKTLNSQQAYTIKILSVNEIANPSLNQIEANSVQLGQSRTSFGLSNTQTINSSEDLATRQALDNRPSTLHVVRYSCS